MKLLHRQGLFTFVVAIVFIVLFIGSAASPPPAAVPLKFDYVPMTRANVDNKVKIAILKPSFAKTFKDSDLEPFKTFAKNMEPDFVELLSARGFQYSGPFLEYDEMVYTDKKNADLILEVQVDLNLSGNAFKQTPSSPLYPNAQIQYWLEGDVVLAGKIMFELYEPFTKTKLWVKNAPIEEVSFFVKSHKRYSTPTIPHSDPGVWNSLVPNLEKIYQNAFVSAWRYLDPEEMAQKKTEADEIKKNSGFIKN